jgi:hypothetical protein
MSTVHTVNPDRAVIEIESGLEYIAPNRQAGLASVTVCPCPMKSPGVLMRFKTPVPVTGPEGTDGAVVGTIVGAVVPAVGISVG